MLALHRLHQAESIMRRENRVNEARTPAARAGSRPIGSRLVEVRGLVKSFPLSKGWRIFSPPAAIQAVRGLNFSIDRGETLGLVGESGCGKSTTGFLLLRLLEPDAGKIHFEGRDLLALSREEMRRQRRDMQIIFQDPHESMDPRMTVGEIVSEPLAIHRIARGRQKERLLRELFDFVGLSRPLAKRYPHELSGGQRQRVGIARALALRPRLIVCDEPVSALDVSIQAQIINLLQDIQKELGLTYLFISHDLSVVKHISTRVAVMYLGKIVELVDKRELYRNPLHPYTEALISAIPIADPQAKRKQIILKGELPNPASPPKGCPFNTRCPYAMDICFQKEPPLVDVGGGHWVACHLRAPAPQTKAVNTP